MVIFHKAGIGPLISSAGWKARVSGRVFPLRVPHSDTRDPCMFCILHVPQHWIQTVAFETAQCWVIHGRQFHFTEFIRNSVVAGVLFLSNNRCLLLAGTLRSCYIESTFCGRAVVAQVCMYYIKICSFGRFFKGVSGRTTVGACATQERAERCVVRRAGYC